MSTSTSAFGPLPARAITRTSPPHASTPSPDSNSRAPRADEARHTILWIDDAVEPTDPGVRLLALEGFAVDCADSGAAGLRMLYERSYDALILDLRLPDISGLLVLERLRADGVSVPVLMLTGYGDVKSATLALRLGVDDFRWKPLIGDELIAAVRGVVNVTVESNAPLEPLGPIAMLHPDVRGSQSLAAIVRLIDEKARAADQYLAGIGSEGHEPFWVCDDVRQRLVASLIRALEDPDLDIPAFLACASALRHVLAAPEAHVPLELANRLHNLLTRRGTTPVIEHRRVRSVIAKLEAAARDPVRLTEHDLARELGVDPAHLGRLVRSQTGIRFRQWRSALAVRIAVRELADDDAQIAQIAFGTGYEHPSQLDREFRRIFGISPRDFRRLRKSVAQFIV